MWEVQSGVCPIHPGLRHCWGATYRHCTEFTSPWLEFYFGRDVTARTTLGWGKTRAATHWLPCSTQLMCCPSKHLPVVLGHPHFLLKSKGSENNTKLNLSTQRHKLWDWWVYWLFFKHLIITCKSWHGKMLCFLFQLSACTCWDDARSLCGCCWLSWEWEFTWPLSYLCKWWPLESFKGKWKGGVNPQRSSKAAASQAVLSGRCDICST